MGLLNFILNRKKINKKLTIGLALSGGGAKGFAHIGVIRAFEEEGITFSMVSGTSAGSIVGGAFAIGKTSQEMEVVAKSVKAKDIKTSKLFFVPSKTTGIEALAQDLVGENTEFKDLKLPFYAVATDLEKGVQKIFNIGNVAKCISASCAVPGFFVPVTINGVHYVDGGLLNNIPTNVLYDNFCDVIIAVDLNINRGQGTDSIRTFDVLLASYRIMSSLNSKLGRELADVVISPDLSKFKATKLDDVDVMIKEGYIATKEKMPEILRVLKTKKRVNRKKIIKLQKREEKKHKKQIKIMDKIYESKIKENTRELLD